MNCDLCEKKEHERNLIFYIDIFICNNCNDYYSDEELNEILDCQNNK